MARSFLEKSITGNNDLAEIARHTFDWEGGTRFGLTDMEILNIKVEHPENYEKQW